MPSLPENVQQHLAGEFEYCVTRITQASDVGTKLYYFSVFFGETGRLLNMHWDADLALLWSVAQHASNAILARMAQATGEFPVGGFPDGFGAAIDQVSVEIAEAFSKRDLDLARLYAALGRVSELTFATTGNGAYLVDKGAIKI